LRRVRSMPGTMLQCSLAATAAKRDSGFAQVQDACGSSPAGLLRRFYDS